MKKLLLLLLISACFRGSAADSDALNIAANWTPMSPVNTTMSVVFDESQNALQFLIPPEDKGHPVYPMWKNHGQNFSAARKITLGIKVVAPEGARYDPQAYLIIPFQKNYAFKLESPGEYQMVSYDFTMPETGWKDNIGYLQIQLYLPSGDKVKYFIKDIRLLDADGNVL